MNSEINTARMRGKVLRAAKNSLYHRPLQADFEHGHWWITCVDCLAQWDVVDCYKDGVDCFGFEQVSYGVDE